MKGGAAMITIACIGCGWVGTVGLVGAILASVAVVLWACAHYTRKGELDG